MTLNGWADCRLLVRFGAWRENVDKNMETDSGDVTRALAQSSPWLTVKEAADHASLSADSIYTACERGELRHARVGGRRTIRLRPEWIDAWLEQHTRG